MFSLQGVEPSHKENWTGLQNGLNSICCFVWRGTKQEPPESYSYIFLTKLSETDIHKHAIRSWCPLVAPVLTAQHCAALIVLFLFLITQRTRWPFPALLVKQPISQYLFHALENVLGDKSNLLVTERIDVPSWRTCVAWIVSRTTTSSDNDTNKNKLLRNINHEGWGQSLATFCKTIPFVLSVLLQN